MFAWICRTLRKPTGTSRMRQASLPSLPSPLLPALLLMAVPIWPSHGTECTAAAACPAASTVLQRFFLSQEKASGWPMETIEIDASLPKLKKAGWLRAIRRTFPAEKPHYDVLEIAGDRTVKNQVIARTFRRLKGRPTFPLHPLQSLPRITKFTMRDACASASGQRTPF